MPGVKTNEREGTRAVLRHSRMSATKVRQVLDLIRGQDVDRAAETLSLGDREAAVTVGKVLASAVANAVHNDGLDAEELFVSACFADEGSTLKRWRPRARGRATRIRKRTSPHHHHREPAPRRPDRPSPGQAGGRRRPAVPPGGRLPPPPAVGARTLPPRSPSDQDTGSEAWDEEATHADDVVTETEAGPLEESDRSRRRGDADDDDDDRDRGRPPGRPIADGDAEVGDGAKTADTDDTDDDTTTASPPKRRASRWARR